MPLDINEDRVGSFVSKYRKVDVVRAVMSKSGIAIEDILPELRMNIQIFGDIVNVIMSWEISCL